MRRPRPGHAAWNHGAARKTRLDVSPTCTRHDPATAPRAGTPPMEALVSTAQQEAR